MAIIRTFLYSLYFISIIIAFDINSEPTVVTDSVFTAKIIRDEWGVPHIYGKRDADASLVLHMLTRKMIFRRFRM